MDKIYVHIFSFDRPAQLNLLLDSIDMYDKEKRFEITVQYCFSKINFLEGYKILENRFSKINFIKETRYAQLKSNNPMSGYFWFNLFFWLKIKRFKFSSSDFKQILVDSIDKQSSDYCMFLTDDSLFYREIEISDKILLKIKDAPSTAYSMALGKNIEEGNFDISGQNICWELSNTNNGSIWKYPFSVDGRIYNRMLLARLIKNIIFSNPNTFESILVVYNRIHKVFKRVYANNDSSLIGFELNRVQQVYENHDLGIDGENINNYYLMGFKLKIDFDEINLNRFRPDIKNIYLQRGDDIVSLM